jgi:2-aminoethylphosphonate transport system substrate-binding protein
MSLRVLRRVPLAAVVVAVLSLALAACGGTGASDTGSGRSVTVYSADGLGPWYQKRFAEFTAQTGIAVNYVEAGSGEVVSRVDKEKANPQADVLVTLPPFIQRAASAGLVQPQGVSGTNLPAVDPSLVDPQHRYVAIVNNYPVMIANPTAAAPAPTAWTDLADPRFKGKLQYSTPGQAGDGTAVLLQAQHLYGKQGALDYLRTLQANNVGPSSSTGKLQPKVSSGELAVANGDVQMNLQSVVQDHSAFSLFFPTDATGARSTFPLPYDAGLAVGAPHAAEGRQLLDFLLSAPVQQTVGADAFGIPVRKDVPTNDPNSARIAQLMTGVTVWQPDWDAVARDLDGDVAAYNQAIAR